MRLYLDKDEIRKAGFGEPMVRFFETLAEFVNTQQALTTAQTDIATNADSITALSAADTALAAQIATVASNVTAGDAALDYRLDTYDALAPFVRQDQTAAPAYTPYAGQTVSAGYVQAEAQATDNAVKALSVFAAALKAALQAVNVLT